MTDHMQDSRLYELAVSLTRIQELEAAMVNGFLSNLQLHVFRDRCSNPCSWIDSALRCNYRVSQDEAVRKCLVPTASGLPWVRHMGGARDPSLSPFDVPRFRDAVLQRAADLNCIIGMMRSHWHSL
jgi:hypothetical protein